MKMHVLVLGITFLSGATVAVIADEVGTTTKEQFVKSRLEWAKNNPNWKPTKEELEADFDKRDTNKDGVLSKAELDGKLKNQWVNQQLEWAKKNPNWKPTREELEKRFAEIDTNGDGLLSQEEEAAAGKKSPKK